MIRNPQNPVLIITAPPYYPKYSGACIKTRTSGPTVLHQGFLKVGLPHPRTGKVGSSRRLQAFGSCRCLCGAFQPHKPSDAQPSTSKPCNPKALNPKSLRRRNWLSQALGIRYQRLSGSKRPGGAGWHVLVCVFLFTDSFVPEGLSLTLYDYGMVS